MLRMEASRSYPRKIPRILGDIISLEALAEARRDAASNEKASRLKQVSWDENTHFTHWGVSSDTY